MSSASGSQSLLEHFSALKDPRQQWRVLYPLDEILLLVLCATLAGMEDFVEIRLWGEERLDFLRRFLPYDRGVPSHDTLNDVINALEPELFKSCFLAWVDGLRDGAPDIIAIDGKTSRRTHDRSKGRAPLHLVSAWASRQRLVLGQEAVEDKSSEIAAIPLLWPSLVRPQGIRVHALSPEPVKTRAASRLDRFGELLERAAAEACSANSSRSRMSGRWPPSLYPMQPRR